MAVRERCNYGAYDAKKIGCSCNVVDIVTTLVGCFFYLTSEFALLHNTI